MRTTKPFTVAIDPMWRIYACAWLGYAILIAIISRVEDLPNGVFDWMLALRVARSIVPSALLLSLVWPLTGYLERRACAAQVVLAIHAAAALAFAGISVGAMWMSSQIDLTHLSGWIWPFLYMAMIYIVVAVAFYLVRASRAAQRQALAFQEAQNLLVTAELDALRSKLNPHFLFNTLHSIIALTRKNPGAAEAALFRFSDMLRYVLETEKNGSDRVTLDDELDFVRNYLDLEALRLGDRLQVDWDIAPDAGHLSLPPLTLQPLVENSIKHAFNPRSQPGRLVIRVAPHEDRLMLSVRDDGPGADLARIKASKGLGIRTVERRLRLGYGERAGFNINTAPGGGFEVALSLPMEASA
jgi:sensor histidine kinase YesM